MTHRTVSQVVKNSAEFERILQEYIIVIRELKRKAIAKYGKSIEKEFGIK